MTVDMALPDQSHEDTTILLICKSSQIDILIEWLHHKKALEALREMPVKIITEADDADMIRQQLPKGDNISLCEMPADETRAKRILAQAYARVYESLVTPYFIIQRLSKKRRDQPEALLNRLIATKFPLPDINDSVAPILLPTTQMNRTAARAYVNYARSQKPELPVHWVQYLGYISFLTTSGTIEATDPVKETRTVRVHLRLYNGRFNNTDYPEWSYDLVLVGKNRTIICRVPLNPKMWIDSNGETRWEGYEGEVPLDDIPNGDFEFALTPNSSYLEGRTPLKSLRPRPGATTPARTVPSVGPTGKTGIHRYLVHTTGQANSTWLSKQTGDAETTHKIWRKRLFKKDMRAVIRRDGGLTITIALIIYRLTKPFFRNREVWIIGERADTAQDNGMHLFTHMRATEPHREVYYVLDRDSSHFSQMKELGNVIRHSSFRHKLLTLHASVLANAYSLAHMVPSQWRARRYFLHLSWRTKALRVYLKHGINTGVNALQRGTNGYDLYITASSKETAAVLESSGYNDEVAETGLARYDNLAVPHPKEKTILFMPTWRRYLVPKLFGNGEATHAELAGSQYEKGLLEFLESPRLQGILESNGYRLRFLPHYNAKAHFLSLSFANPYIEVLDDKDIDFQTEIKSCSIFVTDYSSVHFDVAYIGTPLIYYQFDAAEFMSKHASQSWFSFETDGFGEVCYTLTDIYSELERLIATGTSRSKKYEMRVKDLFRFTDTQNCSRIARSIEDKLAKMSD